MSTYDHLRERLSLTEKTSSVKMKSAVRTHVPGVVVGIAKDGRVLIFLSTDYDGKGTLTGKYLDISKHGEDAFHLLSQEYDDAAMKKLGFSKKTQQQLIAKAKAWRDKAAYEDVSDYDYLRESLNLTERAPSQSKLEGACASLIHYAKKLKASSKADDDVAGKAAIKAILDLTEKARTAARDLWAIDV